MAIDHRGDSTHHFPPPREWMNKEDGTVPRRPYSLRYDEQKNEVYCLVSFMQTFKNTPNALLCIFKIIYYPPARWIGRSRFIYVIEGERQGVEGKENRGGL